MRFLLVELTETEGRRDLSVFLRARGAHVGRLEDDVPTGRLISDLLPLT